jgi:hypothetical protein
VVEQRLYSLRFDWRRHADFALPASAGLVGMMLILLSTARYGIGLSSDSITYLSVAQNLLTGRGLIEFNGEPLLVFPPFYPLVLALLNQQWFDLATVARYANSLCFGTIVLLATHWLMTHTHSLALVGLGAGATLLSLPLIEVSVYAWSEPLFIVLTLLCLFLLEQYLATEKRFALYVGGLCAGMAYLTRYAGVTLILTGLAVVLWSHRLALAMQIRRAASFCFLALLPISFWFARNMLLSSTFTGERVSSRVPFTHSVHLAANIITKWLLPASLPLALRIGLVGILLTLLLGAVVITLYSHNRGLVSTNFRQITPMGLFVGIYTAFLLLSVTLTALSPVDNRYLSPIYVPLVLISIFGISKLHLIAPQASRQLLLRRIILLGLALWLIYPAHNVIGAVQWYRAAGAGGFRTNEWMNSELIGYLRAHQMQGAVYTNESAAVYGLTGQVFRESPRKYHYESSISTDDLARFQNVLQTGSYAYLVWFKGDWWRSYLYDTPDLAELYHLDPLVTTADGTIYRVTLK